MQFTAPILPPSALANDIAVVARRNGKTAPAYLKTRLVEALMADIATDILAQADFSSDRQIEKALRSVRDFSDELIRAMAKFRYDSKQRRFVNELRRANTEGELTAAQNDLFKTLVEKGEELAIVKAVALLEARRRGLKLRIFTKVNGTSSFAHSSKY